MARLSFALACMSYVCATVMLYTALISEDWLEQFNPGGGTSRLAGKTTVVWALNAVACGLNTLGLVSLFYQVYFNGSPWIRVIYHICIAVSGGLSLGAVLAYSNASSTSSDTLYGFGFNTAVTAVSLAWFTNALLLLHMLMTRKLVYPDRLSYRQKMVVLSFSVLFIYIHLGALVFAALETQWSGSDALLFALVTASSIGYGTPPSGEPPGVPDTTGGKVFTFFWFPVGFILVAWFGKTAWDSFAQSINKQYESRKHRHDSTRPAQFSHDYQGKILSISRRIVVGIIFGVITWFVGAAIFMYTEQWTYFQGMWFAYQSIMTIGFGDLVPASKRVYLLFFFLLFGLGSVAFLISAIAAVFVTAVEKRVTDRNKLEMMNVLKAVKEFEKDTFNILSKLSAEDAEVYDKAWRSLLNEVNVDTGQPDELNPTKLLFQQLLMFSARPPTLSTNAVQMTPLTTSVTVNGAVVEVPMQSPAATARRLSQTQSSHNVLRSEENKSDQ